MIKEPANVARYLAAVGEATEAPAAPRVAVRRAGTLYKMALRHVRPLVQALLKDHGLVPADVDWVVPHQASGPGLDMLPRLGFPAERTVNIIGQFGNCVAASIPMALAHLAASGRVKRGQRVLLLGTGAGFSVAGAVLRW